MGSIKAISACIKTVSSLLFISLCFFYLGCGTSVVQQLVSPSISQILPQSLTAGASDTTVSVVGANFTNQTVTLWNGSALSTTVVDASNLSVTVPATALAAAGTAQVQVQNGQTGESSSAVPVTIASPLVSNGKNSSMTITTSSFPSGVVGTSYSASLSATGGTPSYNWTINSGSLPAGLSLSASTGVISGTPTTSGTFSFSVKVTDSEKPAKTASVTTSIVIAPQKLAIKTTTLASGINSDFYSQTLSATGGTQPYRWSITSGSLPAGLSLTSSTGVISGTPTVNGTFALDVTVKDSGKTVQTATLSTSIALAPKPLSITTATLVSGISGTAYSQTLSATGGTPAYTWTLTSGILPDGIKLSTTGVLSGMTWANGTFTLGVTVTDQGSPKQTATSTLSLSIAAAVPALAITSSSLTSGTSGVAYAQTLAATGGTPAYAWSVTSGAFPAGLSLSTAGVLSGTPTASGTFTLGVTVTDQGSPKQTATSTLSLSIAAPPLTIATSALPSATAKTTYGASLSATGGTAPYLWSVSSGSLPAGLSIASTGVISGTPTATGSYPLGVTVTDSCKPSALSQSATLTLVVTPSALVITNSSLTLGTSGVAYAQTLAATGGTPAYTWSVTSGSLPAGLNLAATTGVISGTPTASGTSSFTATVADNSSPAQTQSVATSITVAQAVQSTGPGTTWYIRPDGGTRYSANLTSGQCDGQADVAYPGTGVNQHCAFNDYRYLWDDWSYNKVAWVIAGGDTVIIRGCVPNAENNYTTDCRVGFDQASSNGGGYTWCVGGSNGSGGCSNPVIPSGTASQHTRILGQNYANCSVNNAVDKSKLTQIFGGFGVWDTLNLGGAQYVDVQCLEVTSHAQCIVHGYPAVPKACQPGTDDYDSDGIGTDVNTHDLLLQDLSVHGHTDRGIKGAIGGVVTALRVDVAYNGMAGWDFDDGSGSAPGGYGTPSLPGSVWNFNYSTIEWNGCNQIYPSTNADTCYDDIDGAYGDGVGTPPGMCLSANIDHSAFNYNTQDGLDLGHIDTGTCSVKITNSTAVGNMGATFKWGPNESPAVFTDNLALANCARLSQPIAGTSSYYNQHLQHWCRSGDNVSFNFRQGGTALIANNTVVGYESTSFDTACWDTSCSNSVLTFQNNLTLGYDNPLTYSIGGQAGGIGGLYFQEPIGTVTWTNNLWSGMRASSFNCPTGYTGDICADPLLVNEPTGQAGNFVETELDNFNFTPSSGSPVIGAGTYLSTVPLDYTGAQRANPPSIGAYEQ
ncbi:MAG: putative Ig domain-containing protein [Acidobacteriaceae bacterium]|nr:putative Ig domain-containing protein [Acidobacteriaceae bacterium]